MFRKLLVICGGNTCHSPMAAALFTACLTDADDFLVESAGIRAVPGGPADALAVQLMAEQGLDISGHCARQLTLELAGQFDLIFVMERGQKHWIERRIPQLRGKVYMLGHWTETAIAAPLQSTRDQLETALAQIHQSVRGWAQHLP